MLAAVALLLFGGEKRKETTGLDAYAKGLPEYELNIKMIPDEGSLAFTETLTVTNRTGERQEKLVLRTWLNAFSENETSPAALEEIAELCYPNGFVPGQLRLYDVKWNGAACEYRYVNADRTALEIVLPAWNAGETGVLTVRAVAVLPEIMYMTGRTAHLWSAAHVWPVLAMDQDGAWDTAEYAPVGDPFSTGFANYHIAVETAEGFVPVCSAKLKKNTDGKWTGGIACARDVGLVLTDALVSRAAVQNGVSITCWAETGDGAERMLADARRAIKTYEALYGAYPWADYTLVGMDMPLDGQEFTALSLVNASLCAAQNADALETQIAREAAHQWFYAQVATDEYVHPWQDEALAEYAALRYVKSNYGQSGYETVKYYRVDMPMQERVPGVLTPGSPISAFDNLQDYQTVVCGRGAALPVAMDELLPQGTDAFLRDYVSAFAFTVASREDFERALSEAAGMDVAPLVTDYLDTLMN